MTAHPNCRLFRISPSKFTQTVLWGEDVRFRPSFITRIYALTAAFALAVISGSSMITKNYRFADKIIQISSVYPTVHDLCARYRTDEDPPSFYIRATREDIAFEREKAVHEDELTESSKRHYCENQLEAMAVHRKISEQMVLFDTLLMHGSCVAVDGEAFLFTAKSGTGKSTHTRLWRQLFKDRAIMVNDDKPLIRVTENGAIAYGNPWDGKHRLSNNVAVPLKAICILQRAERNSIQRITKAEAYPMLLQQIYRPLDAAAMQKTLQLIDLLTENVSLWRLGCNMDPEAAKVSSDAMKGQKYEAE